MKSLNKKVLLTAPQLKDNGDLADNVYLDTAGWGHLEVVIATGVIDAAFGSDAETDALFVEECDTAAGTYTPVTGAALAAAIPDTGDKSLYQINIDLHKSHKRYMRVMEPHAGDGTAGVTACIIGILSEPDGEGPIDAAGMGLAELVNA